jgi:hypothetical protein
MLLANADNNIGHSGHFNGNITTDEKKVKE